MSEDREARWQVRNIAEYAYCPRLFYYMQVEGIFLPSHDTVAGEAVHATVDAPSRLASNQEDPPPVLRSLVLDSERLRLTGKIDLVELTGQQATPIEYRKGRPRRVSLASAQDIDEEAEQQTIEHIEPWPTDIVQVALLALLLEEHGYTVTHAELYYHAERRRLRVAIAEHERQFALQVLQAAQEASKGPRPPPLINDPRCERCSLRPLCLPDELHATTLPEHERRPRSLWPPHADGLQVVAMSDGFRVGVRGECLLVTDREGQTVKQVPLSTVESLALLGHIQISSQAIHTLADRSIPIAWLSAAGRLIAINDPLDSVSAQVRRAQVKRCDDELSRIALAKALIAAKIANQRTVLMRNHEALPPRVPVLLAEQQRAVQHAQTLDEIRGHEGQAAAIYFEHASGMFKGELAHRFDVHGRTRRPPPDPINALLSFGYACLVNECISALRLARLEPTIGVYHISKPGRPALALDLMEPFRPLIADSIAINLVNRGEIGQGHFVLTSAGCMLTDHGRKAFFQAWGRRLDTVVTHQYFGYRLSYRRMLHLHARLLAAWCVGEVSTLEFLTTR